MASPRPLPFIPLTHASLAHNRPPSITTCPHQQPTNIHPNPATADRAAVAHPASKTAAITSDKPITPPPDATWDPSITVTAHLPQHNPPSAAAAAAAQQAFPFDPNNPVHAGLASRIATFYRQRSIQVAAQQQQRCREWAAAQRARCTELTQAGMLVVAWYVRDRIARRRRRARRRFRDCLAQLSAPCANPCGAGRSRGNANTAPAAAAAAAAVAGSRITRGERVRRWVLSTPDVDLKSPAEALAQVPASPDLDPEEVAFRMAVDAVDGGDHQPQTSKATNDARLYAFADALIKRNAGRTSLPIFGELSFDEDSGSESDSDSDDVGAGPWPAAKLGPGYGSQPCNDCDENENDEDCDDIDAGRGDDGGRHGVPDEETAAFSADGCKANVAGLVTPRTSH